MQRQVRDQVVYYTFESLAPCDELVQAVSSRLGGVSQGPYASLNLSKGVGDDPLAVDENMTRFCRVLGIAPGHLVSPYQRHTANVQRVGRVDWQRVIPNCDVLVTDEPDTLLMMRYADCTPLVVYDPGKRALALAHSGWRGTVQGAARAAVAALVSEYGSRPSEMRAAIGPSIGPCCYEVGDEVADAVTQAFGGRDGLLPAGSLGRAHFDLWAANYRWLREAGVAQIEVSEICTACHNDEFFSYRAGARHTGHFAVVAGLREGA